MQRIVRPLALIMALCCSSANANHPDAAPGSSKQREDFNRIELSLSALTNALIRIGEEKQRQPFARTMVTTASEHQQLARELLDSGHPEQARNELDNAMVTIKTAIATLRNRETLIRSLNFDNPADEYHYELDRFETYSMLVNLLLERMKPDPSKRAKMEQLMQQAWDQEGIARLRAEAQDYKAAIGEQERSNKLLLQAIRRGGIYVPG
ncbi:hypothetical protein [Motiliproteus sediminis]|uniref:hypothetical protein n=1 Tax=Motiliproteus sediminis TaxID=1468178 RepID=UPI001AEFD8FD|nr:hypothetical protein [Motiliproteus sediminis]